MNLECLSRICRWLFARFRFAFIGTVVLSLISLMSCKTQHETMSARVETHSRASLAQYDSTRYVDLTITHDTIAVIRTETIWREPDSIGNIYPLMTSVTESAAKRQTRNNVVATRIDTLFITSNTNDVATETSVTTVQPSYQARAAPALDGVNRFLVVFAIITILTIAAVIVVKLLRRFSFP